MIETIPNDVLLEIFMRLPDCQSITRCSSVSKRWRSLIAGNSRLERRFNLRRPEICTQLIGYAAFDSALHRYYELTSLEKSSTPLPEFGLDFLPWAREEDIRIRGSAGDLMLVSRRNDDMEESNDRDFIVCNPFTKQVVVLPRSPINFATRWALVLESKSCGAREGCNCNVRYRAVLFSPILGDGLVAAVLCSETGQWDETEFRCPLKSYGLTIFPVNNGNNTLHWLSGDRYLVAYSPFRLPGERLGSVGLPDGYEKAPTEDLLLGSVGGRLRLAQTVREEVEGGAPRKVLRVWGRTLCESWVLEHEAEVELAAAYVFAFNTLDPDRVFVMGLAAAEEEEDMFVHEYNIKESESSFRRVGRLPMDHQTRLTMATADYCTLLHRPTPTVIPPLPTPTHSLLLTLTKLLPPWLNQMIMSYLSI